MQSQLSVLGEAKQKGSSETTELKEQLESLEKTVESLKKEKEKVRKDMEYKLE